MLVYYYQKNIIKILLLKNINIAAVPSSAVKPIFHKTNFITRIDFSLFKLNKSIISSSRKLIRENKRYLRTKKFVKWKTALMADFFLVPRGGLGSLSPSFKWN